MGNVCGDHKLSVHIQPSFTYETIRDRFIDDGLEKLIANATLMNEDPKGNEITPDWSIPLDGQPHLAAEIERRMSIQQGRRKSQAVGHQQERRASHFVERERRASHDPTAGERRASRLSPGTAAGTPASSTNNGTSKPVLPPVQRRSSGSMIPPLPQPTPSQASGSETNQASESNTESNPTGEDSTESGTARKSPFPPI